MSKPKKAKNQFSEVSVILSICIPTYNRATHLAALLNTVPLECADVEVVILDDGSSDNTRAIVEKYQQTAVARIRYFYQSNSGRSVALQRAVLLASAEYTILMDSDDYFVEGWYSLFLSCLVKLRKESESNQRPLAGIVFGVRLLKNGILTNNSPSFEGVTNFTKLRADQSVQGDLKEIVKTSVIKENLYEIPEGCRRVPTSLLWARIAEGYDCLTSTEILAVKEYLPGGMSDRILVLRSQNPQPLVLLYLLLSESKAYDSTFYRWRSRILWARYSLHQRRINFTHLWQYIALWPGLTSYCLDRVKLKCLR